MELIITVPDDYEKDVADVLNDVVAWVLSDGAKHVAQYATLDGE